ncbi:MAG: hypothetical protein M1830_010747 [Pleopsidium flavum]|nr:MAG: hypothetical protein M1830_010747 [Pleopsidium flavum]
MDGPDPAPSPSPSGTAPPPPRSSGACANGDFPGADALAAQPHPTRGKKKKKKVQCRYFGTRNGKDFQLLAESKVKADSKREAQSRGGKGTVTGENSQGRDHVQVKPSQVAGLDLTSQDGRQFNPGPVEMSRVVQKPVPRAQVDDPREFQIQQLRRRFSTTEKNEDDGTMLNFRMAPSDPDFPFEMAGLECVLKVPLTYPTSGRPSLHVTNKEMGRGYQINVEKGFDALVAKSQRATLLGLMNALDKQLEALLSEQKAETIKVLPNIGPRPPPPQAGPGQGTVPQQAVLTEDRKVPETYSAEQKAQASVRRETETRQLEARLGRLPLFSKSSDGIVYTIPIEPRRRGDLPVPLQLVRTVKLFVPFLYNLQPCGIELQGVTKDATNTTEKAFEQRARENPEISLMGHINYLSQNMHVMATMPAKEIDDEADGVSSLQLADAVCHKPAGTALRSQTVGDRSHIQVIPRPPEWSVGHGQDGGSESDDYDSYDSGDESTDDVAEGLEPLPECSGGSPERGILLSFPFLELYGIELLELVSLCITIKCERCKDTMDVSNLRNNVKGDVSGVRSESCKKCASGLSIGTGVF